jgi:3-oxoacyl-[acyl-carrier protein] reductase
VATALVTGASRGIGAACARVLAADGFDVAINYARDADGAARVVAEVEALGRRAIAIQADVSQEEQAAALVAQTETDLGPIDSLVANAGITKDGPAIRIDAEAWRAVIDTNLTGAFFTMRPVLRGMLKRRGGSIVAMSSVVGQIGNPGQASYAASKAGLVGLVKVLANEGGARGVRVNAIAPGFVTTGGSSGVHRDSARYDPTWSLRRTRRNCTRGCLPLLRAGILYYRRRDRGRRRPSFEVGTTERGKTSWGHPA